MSIETQPGLALPRGIAAQGSEGRRPCTRAGKHLCGGILAKFSAYYNGWRPHVSLGKDAPDRRPIERFGDIVAHAILGGLHHRYARI
jgi:hypothetical protein